MLNIFIRQTRILQSETKVYFNCVNQNQCLKKAYIKYDSDNMSTVELFLSESDHNHLRKKISAEAKKEILNYFNQNIFSFKSILKILERKNLNLISAKQFSNLKQRFKSKSFNL